MPDQLNSPIKNGERGSALMQVLVFSMFVAAISYFAFSYLAQYQKNSIRITDRSKYRDIAEAKVQTLGDPTIIIKPVGSTGPTGATQLLLTDIAE